MLIYWTATGQPILAGQLSTQIGGFECKGIPYGNIVFWLLVASFLLLVLAASLPTGDSPESGEMYVYAGILALLLVSGLYLQTCPLKTLGPFGVSMFSVLWPFFGVMFSGVFLLRAGTLGIGERVTTPLYAVAALILLIGILGFYLKYMYEDYGLIGIVLGSVVTILYIWDVLYD